MTQASFAFVNGSQPGKEQPVAMAMSKREGPEAMQGPIMIGRLGCVTL